MCGKIYLYFKDFNDYGIKEQITRSALFVPSNIAERVEESSDKDIVNSIKKASK